VQSRSIIILLSTLVVLVTATACSGVQAPELITASPSATPTQMFTPSSSATPTQMLTPTPSQPATLDDGRFRTAMGSYPLAEEKAKAWNPTAVLYEIVPSYTMQRNLGLPPSAPGWFFKFGMPGSPLEYFVQVLDGHVSGSTEAQPILIEPLPYETLPINIKDLKVDSSHVLETIQKARGGELKRIKIDYHLVHLKGDPNPVWSLYDDNDPGSPLISIDAVTGETVPDPFLDIRRK
jgi:hypothetical protein